MKFRSKKLLDFRFIENDFEGKEKSPSQRLCAFARDAVFVFTLSAALLLAGCETAQPYRQPPDVKLGQWTFNSGVASGAKAVSLNRWWESFHDPTLNALIENGLKNNRDIRLAVLRIEEASAQLNQIQGARWPGLSAQGEINKFRPSQNAQQSITLPRGILGNPNSITVKPGVDSNQTLYSLGLGASWEPDFFGRVRSRIHAGEANQEIARADADGVSMMVVASIAQNYFDCLAARDAAELQKNIIGLLQKNRDMIARRIQDGDLPKTALDRADANLLSAKQQLEQWQTEEKIHALTLGVLTGGLPEDVLTVLQNDKASLPQTLPDIPVGQRADLLRRRPDIRMAERRIVEAAAEVGESVAEQFPKFTISAQGAFESLSASNLFEHKSLSANILPFIEWRIFEGGAIRAEIHAAKTREKEAALAYEKTVIGALEDAERAMARVTQTRKSVALQNDEAQKMEALAESVERRLRIGDADPMEYFPAQIDALVAKQNAVAQKGVALDATVAMFKALGFDATEDVNHKGHQGHKANSAAGSAGVSPASVAR